MWGRGQDHYDDADRHSDRSSESSYAEDRFVDGHACTDVPCCGLFGAAVVAFCVLFHHALAVGNLGKIVGGIDQHGNICGIDDAVINKPVLYYCPENTFSSDQGDLSLLPSEGVCLQGCPSGTPTDVIPSTIPSCEVPEAYMTKTLAGRYCIPDAPGVSEDALRTATDSSDQKRIEAFVAGVSKQGGNWQVFLVVMLASIVMGYLYLFLLREFAPVLIWLSLALLVLILIGAGVFIWNNADLAGGKIDEATDDVEFGENATFAAHVVAVVLWISAAVIVFVVCFCHHAIEISIACVQAGTDVMWHMPMMLLAPMVKALVKVGLFLLCLFGFLKLLSTGEVTGTTLNREFIYTHEQYVAMSFYLFFSLWILGFVTALYQFSVAFSVAKYYHTAPDDHPHAHDSDRHTGFCAVGEGAWIGLTKHSGSLAFGTFILAITQFVHYLAEYVERKNEQGVENPVVHCLTCCISCCCACCEQVVKFVNRNVFFIIAITSKSFCGSVRSLLHIIADYGGAMAVLNGATVIFQIVGGLLITAASGFVAELLFFHNGYEEPEVGVVISCLIAAVVAYSFMTIFDATTDTLLFCYALDHNRHNHACTAPEDLKRLFDEVDSEKQEQAERHGHWTSH